MPDRPDAIMLFAAGHGTRMAPLTDTRPKPLVEVAGRPLLDHAMDLVTEAQVNRVVANTHYLGEMLVPVLERQGIGIRKEPTLLDTGGGLKRALPMLPGDAVMTLNTDAVWTGRGIIDLLRAAWRPDRMDALLMLVPVAAATGHAGDGDFDLDSEGRLRRGTQAVYSGLQIVKSARVAEVPDEVFSLNRVWDAIAADGRLFGVLHRGGWCDVGRPGAIPLAEAMLRELDHV